MANAKKTIVIVGLVGLLSAGAYYGIKTINVSNAADKLDYDIDEFYLKSVKQNTLGAVAENDNRAEMLAILERLQSGMSGLGLSLKIPTSLIYTISLNVNNPSGQDIKITKPYITVFIKKANGKLASIAKTAIPEGIETTIKAKSRTNIKHDVEINIASVALLIPDFLQYIIGRLKGEKATKQIIVNATLDAMGLTIPIQKIVNL